MKPHLTVKKSSQLQTRKNSIDIKFMLNKYDTQIVLILSDFDLYDSNDRLV